MSSYLMRRELLDDPLGRGYAGMSDAAVLADITDVTLRPLADIETLASAEIYEVVIRAEYQALAPAEKTELQIILGLGDSVQVGAASKARAALAGMFGPGTATRAALMALVTNLTQSRAAELGITNERTLSVQGVAAARLPDQPSGG